MPPTLSSASGGSLWRQPDFLKLWVGQTVSVFGDQLALVAIPLTAVLTLQADAVQMGLLGEDETLPFLLFGLLAGVWVDRLRRRPILIGADLGRAALLASVPVAAALGMLSLPFLLVVAFLVGVLNVCFDVAYQAFVPVLVRREHVVEGNSRLEVSRSVANLAGPGLGGVLVQLLGAPLVLLVDGVSFALSALSLLLIRAPEPAPVRPAERPGLWREIGAGLRYVLHNPLLRSIAGATATSNLFSSLIGAVYILFVTRELGLSPTVIGLILAAVGPGGLLGAVLAGRLARRLGVGPTIVAAMAVGGLFWLLVPLAGWLPTLAAPLLALAWFGGGGAGTLYNITQVSLRQQITPDHLLGRMNATMRMLVWGTLPIGSLLGGLLGAALGLGPTLLIGALGSLSAFLWVLLSPVRSLREAPALAEAGEPPA